MGKIIKSFDKSVTEYQLEHSGLTNFYSWERLLPHLNDVINLKKGEKIIGLVASKDGLEIRLQTK